MVAVSAPVANTLCTSQRVTAQSHTLPTRGREREQYSKVSQDLVAVAPTTERMKVHDKFIPNPTDGTYLLSLETPMPIFTVALQSDVPVELLESPDNTVRVYSTLRHTLRHPTVNAFATRRLYPLITHKSVMSASRLQPPARTLWLRLRERRQC